MASTNDATVNAFYLAYYGRPADPAGLAFWSQALTTSNGDFSSIITAFSTSAEATAHLGTGTATDQVSKIYQQLFGHAPDADGLAYWTNAISSGNMSLAEAAIQITHGAQLSDLTVSTLRQDAAAQFTATVAASGVAYDGDAGIIAARVMIGAVTATSSAADIQSLVTAGASLVQTAHDNPAVITALANGGDLNTLLSTASGQSDPVALVQALASLGKAAVADPAGLTALLHGGGVAGLLASLPAGTTLKDVAAAVDTGGLAAGTTVATTPVDTTPVVTAPVVITPTIAFAGIDGKELPTATIPVVNAIFDLIDLHGKPANATATAQVSLTGHANDWKTVSGLDSLDDGTYYVRYVVADKAGNSGTSNAIQLTLDSTVAAPTIHLATDSGTSQSDGLTNDGTIKITGLQADETWTYSFDGIHWNTGTTVNGGATILTTGEGVNTLQIRTVETVDGQDQFTSTAYRYTVDTTAPAQGLALKSVEGAPAGSTHTTLKAADVVLSYTGAISIANNDAVFYTINGGGWQTATKAMIDTVHKTVTIPDVDLSHGSAHIVVQTTDGAGNHTNATFDLTGPPDTTAPVKPALTLFSDTGISPTDHITSNGNVVVSGLEVGSTWEYSTNAGVTWTVGNSPDATGTAYGYTQISGEQTWLVRATDAAGNVSANSSIKFTYESYLGGALIIAGHDNINGFVTTSNAGLAAFQVLLDNSHPNDVTTTYLVSTTGASYSTWDASTPLSDGYYYFKASMTDAAGNAGITLPLAVHIDNSVPATPIITIDDTGAPGDGLTADSQVMLSNIDPAGTIQYSEDGGQTWSEPLGVQGNGIGYIHLTEGEHTLEVRAINTAGTLSAAATAHVTVDTHVPAGGLTLGHIGNGAQGDSHTNLDAADVVFSYTGTIAAGDTITYSTDAGQHNLPVTDSMIDLEHKTITLQNLDLNPDITVLFNVTSLAGASASFQSNIDGPNTAYFVNFDTLSPGLTVDVQQDAHFYLTASGQTVQVFSQATDGDAVPNEFVTINAQQVVAQGILGAGPSADAQTHYNEVVYGLGTDLGDTLTGNDYAWGFGGDDTITAGTGATYGSTIIGGTGADKIHTESTASTLVYSGSSQDSFLGAGTDPAHGFDTVYVSTSLSSQFQEDFKFEGASVGTFSFHNVQGTYTGSETGDALYSLLNASVGSGLDPNGAAVVIQMGTSVDSRGVSFLVFDADNNHTIDDGDFVIQIVGTLTGGSSAGGEHIMLGTGSAY